MFAAGDRIGKTCSLLLLEFSTPYWYKSILLNVAECKEEYYIVPVLNVDIWNTTGVTSFFKNFRVLQPDEIRRLGQDERFKKKNIEHKYKYMLYITYGRYTII